MMTGKLIEKSVILVDKPKGPTSFDIVERVSGILGVKKAGHSGTLDPNATGLMLIALGEARKAMPVLFGLDKEYTGTMKLHGDVEAKKLEKAMKPFIGEITQLPPVRSAVARKPRKRKVFEWALLETSERDVEFRVLCQAGTYIRKLAHDLGLKIGCGAHLTELRRMKIGPFLIEKSITLPDLEGMPKNSLRRVLMPLEKALEMIKLPRITIKDEHEKKIRNGSPIRRDFVREIPEGVKEGDYCGIFDEKGGIVCLGKFISKTGTVAKTERVFLT